MDEGIRTLLTILGAAAIAAIPNIISIIKGAQKDKAVLKAQEEKERFSAPVELLKQLSDIGDGDASKAEKFSVIYERLMGTQQAQIDDLRKQLAETKIELAETKAEAIKQKEESARHFRILERGIMALTKQITDAGLTPVFEVPVRVKQ